MNRGLVVQLGIALLCLLVYDNAAASADLPRLGPMLNHSSEILRAGFHYGGESIARASSMILYVRPVGVWDSFKDLLAGIWALLWSFRGIFEGYAAESRRQAEPGWIAVGSVVLYVIVNNAWMYVTGQKPLLTLLGIAVGKAWLSVAGRAGMRRRQANYDSDSSSASSETSSEESSEEEETPKKKKRVPKTPAVRRRKKAL
jgi:hypothetical protein